MLIRKGSLQKTSLSSFIKKHYLCNSYKKINMKKILLVICFTLAGLSMNAQFEIQNYDDNSVVIDGQTLSFADTGCDYEDSCNWRFKVINTSNSEPLNMKIFIDNMINSDGSNVQLCFSGTCLNSIDLGSSYPFSAAVIPPGGSTGPGNYFWNQNPSSTTTPMSWTLRFQAFDASGFETGSPLSVTYSFDPSLSIENVDLAPSVEVFPTKVKNALTVSSNGKLNAKFYDILGKNVKQVDVLSGESKIDVTDLTPQLYIIRFSDDRGNTLIKKIIVK
jgi:hypothetical protein